MRFEVADAIISREEARAQGLKRYFTGERCPRGHTAPRYVSTKQCVDCLLVWKRTWREANRDRFNAQARAARAANPEKARARYKKWQSTKDGRAAKARLQRERRARLRGSNGRHSVVDLVEILSAQRGRCAYCRVKVGDEYEADHIIPLALGGSNSRRNIQIVCPPCNRRKRTKDPIRFAQELGRLI